MAASCCKYWSRSTSILNPETRFSEENCEGYGLTTHVQIYLTIQNNRLNCPAPAWLSSQHRKQKLQTGRTELNYPMQISLVWASEWLIPNHRVGLRLSRFFVNSNESMMPCQWNVTACTSSRDNQTRALKILHLHPCHVGQDFGSKTDPKLQNLLATGSSFSAGGNLANFSLHSKLCATSHRGKNKNDHW
jgi:hypothetical protein